MQIRTKGSFLLLAVLSVCLFSACTQRRYASRMIRIGGQQMTQVHSSPKTGLPEQVSEKVDHSTNSISTELSQKVLDQEELNGGANLPTPPKDLNISRVIRANAGVSLALRIKGAVQLKRDLRAEESQQHRSAREPQKLMEDALLTFFAVLLLLAIFGGILLLLNHWFLHLSSTQILKGLLALAFGVFIVLLLTLSE